MFKQWNDDDVARAREKADPVISSKFARGIQEHLSSLEDDSLNRNRTNETQSHARKGHEFFAIA
jgi:hypothetical protein